MSFTRRDNNRAGNPLPRIPRRTSSTPSPATPVPVLTVQTPSPPSQSSSTVPPHPKFTIGTDLARASSSSDSEDDNNGGALPTQSSSSNPLPRTKRGLLKPEHSTPVPFPSYSNWSKPKPHPQRRGSSNERDHFQVTPRAKGGRVAPTRSISSPTITAAVVSPSVHAAQVVMKKPLKSSLKSFSSTRPPIPLFDLTLPSSSSSSSSYLPTTTTTPSRPSPMMEFTKSEPTTPKIVSFDDAQLERVKLFHAEQKPLAVSRDGSPTDTEGETGTDSDWPEFVFGRMRGNFGGVTKAKENGTGTGEARVSLGLLTPLQPCPLLSPRPVILESLALAHPSTSTSPSTSSSPTLRGTVIVHNLAFAKSVIARFTFDAWQTTSDVSARYVESLEGGRVDRFEFFVRVEGMGGAAMMGGGGTGGGEVRRELELALRFVAGEGKEFWDNNGGGNYRAVVRALMPPPSALPAQSTASSSRGPGSSSRGPGSRDAGSGSDVPGDVEGLKNRLEDLAVSRGQTSSMPFPCLSLVPNGGNPRSRSPSPTSPTNGNGHAERETLFRGGASLASRYDFGRSFKDAHVSGRKDAHVGGRRRSPSPQSMPGSSPSSSAGGSAPAPASGAYTQPETPATSSESSRALSAAAPQSQLSAAPQSQSTSAPQPVSTGRRRTYPTVSAPSALPPTRSPVPSYDMHVYHRTLGSPRDMGEEGYSAGGYSFRQQDHQHQPLNSTQVFQPQHQHAQPGKKSRHHQRGYFDLVVPPTSQPVGLRRTPSGGPQPLGVATDLPASSVADQDISPIDGGGALADLGITSPACTTPALDEEFSSCLSASASEDEGESSSGQELELESPEDHLHLQPVDHAASNRVQVAGSEEESEAENPAVESGHGHGHVEYKLLLNRFCYFTGMGGKRARPTLGFTALADGGMRRVLSNDSSAGSSDSSASGSSAITSDEGEDDAGDEPGALALGERGSFTRGSTPSSTHNEDTTFTQDQHPSFTPAGKSSTPDDDETTPVQPFLPLFTTPAPVPASPVLKAVATVAAAAAAVSVPTMGGVASMDALSSISSRDALSSIASRDTRVLRGRTGPIEVSGAAVGAAA